MRRLADIKRAMLYRVTSFAFDPATGTAFYTSDNYALRDLMVVFRENTEDIYTGIEFENGTQESLKFKALMKEAFPAEYAKIRVPETAGLGLKPVSREGTERLVRAALEWSLAN